MGYGFFALKLGLAVKVTTRISISEKVFLNRKNVVFNNIAFCCGKLDIYDNYHYF